ncbi:MAG TPA: aminopeptidase N [Hyphomicrobium sp.]|nr:aminopeptidase N [Hyphomicrobium sp.]
MKTDTPRPIHLKDYRPPDFLIDNVDLTIALHPTRTRVDARLAIRRNPASKNCDAPLRLDGEHLELSRIALAGDELRAEGYLVDDKGLTLKATPQAPFTLETTTYINPDANTALQGIYRSRGVYCSQCEAEGFRRITYFLDRPDILSVYSVRLEADACECPVLLANGNPRERGTLAGSDRHYAVWKDPHPKPCYLFAVVGGDLSSIASTFTTKSKREVDLRIYVEHGKEERAHWAMDALRRSFAWDEERFGREYDLDVFNIVAVSDFNMGAMENKGLNIFNDRLILASADTATDASYEAIESVVAHEYFHNWTGNRITCRDWFQLCLKEGLTVYRDQEFSGDERSRTVQRIADVRQLRALQFPEDQGPLAHPVRPESYIEINNFYTPTVYEKGAELVRMIETILGPRLFRAGMDLYFKRHDGEAATIEDFLRCFEDASDRSLAHFARWYSQAGTPELVCKLDFEASSKTATLTVNQSLSPTPGQPRKEPLYIPLRLGLLGANGHDLPLQSADGAPIENGVVAVTERTQTFQFVNIPTRPVPSLLRGFSAPVNLSIELSDAELAFLMTHDCDLFNRWQAANAFATRAILLGLQKPDSIAAAASAYATALAAALADAALEDAYKAELMKLPTQSDIAREKRVDVDPGAIDASHRAFARAASGQLHDLLLQAYAQSASQATFSPDAKSSGRRALRNAALTLLTARGAADDLARLESHYFCATNMTEAAHALNLLSHHDVGARAKAMAHFYERWHKDHLVIDTWFAAQAQSSLPRALEDVRSLTSHPLFKLTTPNKVRALIGTFAMGNPLQFNRPDGEGYGFVASKVLEIDAVNPQVAARLLASFRSSKALEPGRRAKAEEALRTVAGSERISRDVSEIVLRMLEP